MIPSTTLEGTSNHSFNDTNHRLSKRLLADPSYNADDGVAPEYASLQEQSDVGSFMEIQDDDLTMKFDAAAQFIEGSGTST